MHRPNIRERSGSATGLNSRSHPVGTIVGAVVVFELSCGHAMLDAGESRSPLCIRSTDVVANFVSLARPDVATQTTPANPRREDSFVRNMASVARSRRRTADTLS